MKTKAYVVLVVLLLIACIYFFEKDRIYHLEAPVFKKGASLTNTSKPDTFAKVAEYIHPEQDTDEVFITNINPNEYTKTVWINTKGEKLQIPLVMIQEIKKGEIIPKGYMSAYGQIGYKTKRYGNIAYDVYNKPIKGMRPVFVNKNEYKKNKY